AVEQVIVRPAAIAIDAEETKGAGRIVDAARIGSRSGHEREQLHEVAAVERDLGRLLAFDRASLLVARCVDEGQSRDDLDRFLHAARTELEVDAHARRRAYVHAPLSLRREPLKARLDVVLADGKLREKVVPVRVGLDGAAQPRARAG